MSLYTSYYFILIFNIYIYIYIWSVDMVTWVNDITWYILYYNNDSFYTSTYPTYDLYIYIYYSALIETHMIIICHILYYHMGYAYDKQY